VLGVIAATVCVTGAAAATTWPLASTICVVNVTC
jgi:hypothetical protein